MLTEREHSILSQLKAKADQIMVKRFLRIDVLLKCREQTSIYYVSASAYFPSPTDIDRAFKKLVRIFGRTSTIVDFDIDGTCEIPPLPGPELRDVKKVREVVDNLAKKTFMEIRSALPPDIRDKSNRVSLKGSFISVHARAIDDSITYDFSYTEDPLEAVPLAFFLYERAAEINEQSACISITRATKLKVININRINGYASVYIEPSW